MTGAEQAAGLLLQLLTDVPLHGSERSFKVFERTVLPNRFLVGVNIESMGEPQPGDAVVGICNRMRMPPDLMKTFAGKLPEVNFVLFGFEENESTCVYKVYLEYYDTFAEYVTDKPNPRDPLLMHLGFKWDVFDSSKIAVTEYTWHPMLPAHQMLTRMAEIYAGPRHETSLMIVEGIFRAAAGRMSRNDIYYLDVTEGATPRRSFDVNLYAADLRLRDLAPHLEKLCHHYSIDAERFLPACRALDQRRLGHLAGGVDRQGRDFVTIYYEDQPGDRGLSPPRGV